MPQLRKCRGTLCGGSVMTTLVLSFNLHPAVTCRDFWLGYPNLVMHLKYQIIYNFQKTTEFCPVFFHWYPDKLNTCSSFREFSSYLLCPCGPWTKGCLRFQCSDSCSFLAIWLADWLKKTCFMGLNLSSFSCPTFESFHIRIRPMNGIDMFMWMMHRPS